VKNSNYYEGAILGYIVVSSWEFAKTKDYHFDLSPANSDYTDDSILTIAVAEAEMNNK
jgi:hypothetical protein